ncbi:caspase-1 [Hyalella azteca]|uniref:Caspase-1 n=1 Tax=Hyalella azteca TaxID=294128 RepID=A0A8B7PNF0_HYAAZ|nr:caspase-1 [Hyalella azteca]
MENSTFSMKEFDQSFEDSLARGFDDGVLQLHGPQAIDLLPSDEFILDATEEKPPDDLHGPVVGESYNYSLQNGSKKLIMFNFFKIPGEDDRLGSYRDIETLKKISIAFNFNVEIYEDLVKTDTEKVLDRIQRDKELENTTLLMIVVMSHGDGKNAYCFKSSDGMSVSMEEHIIARFNDINCPQLKGKPKIMVGVFCRDTKNADTSSRPEEISDNFLNDTVIIYSAKEGEKSYRCKENGCFLVQALFQSLENRSFTSFRELVARFHLAMGEYLDPEIKFINFRDVNLF